jgi:predicted nuclease of predicted toxin-antitoxin system
MTRLLLDENFPAGAAHGLAQAGHEAHRVAVLAPGIDDVSVLALARHEQRCLVTFDSDFGELVFQHGALPPPCIVYLRLHPIVADAALALTEQALLGPTEGLFIVATSRGLRRRSFAALARDEKP